MAKSVAANNETHENPLRVSCQLRESTAALQTVEGLLIVIKIFFSLKTALSE